MKQSNKNILELQPSQILNFGFAIGGGIIILLMAVYAYQGWFTRYMADDYCNAVLFSADPVGGLISRYLSGWGGNRYSNIWLVGVSEAFGHQSVQYLPMFHIVIWMASLVWAAVEMRKLANSNWSFLMSAFLGLMLGFFVLYQAPNLYQIVYWRSSMSTHFAPVVYGTALTAYILRLVRMSKSEKIAFPSKLALFISAFLVGGFSEPADAVMITILVLAIVAVWLWAGANTKKEIVVLLSWVLAGAILSLIVMIVSPANERRLGDPPPLPQLLYEMFYYGYVFIRVTVIELPLPTLVSILMPAVLFFSIATLSKSEVATAQKKAAWIFIGVSPFLMYLLIVASFSPSVYGQGYPVPRVRFYARLIMTIILLVDGGLLGALFSQTQVVFKKPFFQFASAVLFAIVAIVYPARATLSAYSEIPEYQKRASLWDVRDEYIRIQINKGVTDLTVPQFDGVYGTKELDTYETHWVNKCAANYYGLNSIRAIPIPEEFIDSYYAQ